MLKRMGTKQADESQPVGNLLEPARADTLLRSVTPRPLLIISRQCDLLKNALLLGQIFSWSTLALSAKPAPVHCFPHTRSEHVPDDTRSSRYGCLFSGITFCSIFGKQLLSIYSGRQDTNGL